MRRWKLIRIGFIQVCPHVKNSTQRVASRMFLYLFTWLPPSDVHFRNIIPERSLNVGGCGVPLAGPGVCRLQTGRGSSYQAIGLFRISRAQARPIQPFPWWSAENRTVEIKRNARCWPLIGWDISRDMNTGLRLVDVDHSMCEGRVAAGTGKKRSVGYGR